MSFRLAFSTAVLATMLAAVSAQQPTPGAPAPAQPGVPSRTPPRAVRPGEDPLKGTAILRGYVVAADTGNPLRRAAVVARSADGRGTGMALTDAQGRFEIKDLPAGRYNISVEKAGYVRMSYGQRRPEQPGTMLDVLDGQLVEKIPFTLPRGGVITGSIVDEFGEPIAGAQVSAMRFRYTGGGRRLLPSGFGTSDDRGIFRVYGLTPGDYYISAAVRAPQQMMGTTTMASAPAEGYAATFFPGTANPSEATRITVRAAQETANVSFGLISTRLARISGRVINSAGAPVAQGFINMRAADQMSAGLGMFNSTMTRPDGTFQLLGVAAGSYMMMLTPRGQVTPETEVASLRITVGQDDLDGVILTTSRGAIAYGVITTDENVPPPVRPQQVNVSSRTLEPETMMVGAASKVNDDWTFEISGLFDTRIITGFIAEAPDWTLKAILHNGVDVTDTPIDFVPGRTIEGLQVVFTRKRTEISGLITGERNVPETDATVIAFSQDPSRWGFATRYVRTARPSQDGRYSLRGLPPHDYLVVAVKDIEVGQWQDPEFLETLSAQAVRVSLNEGATHVQDLKVTRP
jgi:hypothetical protein